MPTYSQDDVIRSLRRYVVESLGSPPWRVRTERVELPDDERPAVVVEPASMPAVRSSRATVPQGNVVWAQAYSAMAYPVLEDTPAESRREATRVADLLNRAILLGLVVPAAGATPERNIGYPERIPLYDYSAVPVVGTAAERRGPDAPYDHLWVEDYGARPLQDAADHRRFTVPLDVRVSWEAPGRATPAAPPADGGAPGTFEPPPATPPIAVDMPGRFAGPVRILRP